MIRIEKLKEADIKSDMLINFKHKQKITKKWVRNETAWEMSEASDVREWSGDKRIWITDYLKQQLERGGFAVGAFSDDTLIGFGCIDGVLRGNTAKYANLTMLFVDDEWQGKGIGTLLFGKISMYAPSLNADKIFISAIPSVETVSFYFNRGCTDAKEIVEEFVDTENDRYMEFLL